MKKFFTSPTNNNYYLNQLSELSNSMFKSLSETQNSTKNSPKLLCWIMTAPSNHRTKVFSNYFSILSVKDRVKGCYKVGYDRVK